MSELSVEWGKTTYQNQTFKDGKVWNTTKSGKGITEWIWTKDGTRHVSGITKGAVEELLEHEPSIVILTKGFDNRLTIPDDIVGWLSAKGLKVINMPTKTAVKMFNHLADCGENVCALFHSTC